MYKKYEFSILLLIWDRIFVTVQLKNRNKTKVSFSLPFFPTSLLASNFVFVSP